MNNQLHEFLIAEKQADLKRELAHNKLVREAENANEHRLGFVANILHALGGWMIRSAERLSEGSHSSARLPNLQK